MTVVLPVVPAPNPGSENVLAKTAMVAAKWYLRVFKNLVMVYKLQHFFFFHTKLLIFNLVVCHEVAEHNL